MKICCRSQILFSLLLILFLPYLFYVPKLYQTTTSEDLSRRRNRKYDHLLLGPAAGQGLPDRLQCQGINALNKTHFSIISHASNLSESITLVTVFALVDQVSTDLITVGNSLYSKVERSMAILSVFVNFIQMTMPHSSVIILTDPTSELLVNNEKVTLYPIKGDYSRNKLMLQRIRSYIAFLEDRLDEHTKGFGKVGHYIFTDSDIAVVGDLGHIFYDYPNFHVALTFRNNKDQPLNSGFVAVRGTAHGILRAKVLLEKVLQVYTTKYVKASRMLGDQLALAWIVRNSSPSFDAKRFAGSKSFVEQIGDASVLFLPCAVYNWTPPEGAGQFHGMPLDVKVVHFKGSRKRLMLEAWNHLNSSSSGVSNMLCLILKSGRTKYDF